MSLELDLSDMTMNQIKEAGEENAPQDVWEWINCGTETELTLQRNRSALERIFLKMRVLHGLEKVSTEARILGRRVKTPVMVAPFANMKSLHPDAELAIARGAAKAGAMMFLGQVSSALPEEVVREGGGCVAWIGEPLNNRDTLRRAMREAEGAGCCAVGICADDFMGVKIRDHLKPLGNRSLSAAALGELRCETTLPFVVKGIMTLEDALAAVAAGVSAVVISNHGGRVLDCCQAATEVLPAIVEAIGARVEVFVDGGFRRGTDVLKALALGARGVLVGRPVCWGLAAAGAQGVARVLQIITDELSRAMMLTNTPDVTKVDRDCVVVT